MLHHIHRGRSWQKTRDTGVQSNTSYVVAHGGSTIFAFQLLRFFANAGLFSLLLLGFIFSSGQVLGDVLLLCTSVGAEFYFSAAY